MLQEAEQRYPWQGEIPDVTLTLRHSTRELVACCVADTLAAEIPDENIKGIFPHPDCANGAPMPPHRKMLFWKGQELVGCRRHGASKDHIENGCLYTVTKFDLTSVTVQLSPSMVPADRPRPHIVLSDFEAGQLLRYAYARTVSGCQGLTFADKRVLLLEAHHPHFCKRKLYVAASRCTNPEMFHIASAEQTREIIQECTKDRQLLSSGEPQYMAELYTQAPQKRAAPVADGSKAKRHKQ